MSYRENSYVDEIVVHVCKFCGRLKRDCDRRGGVDTTHLDCKFKRKMENLKESQIVLDERRDAVMVKIQGVLKDVSDGVMQPVRPAPTSVPGPGRTILK